MDDVTCDEGCSVATENEKSMRWPVHVLREFCDEINTVYPFAGAQIVTHCDEGIDFSHWITLSTVPPNGGPPQLLWHPTKIVVVTHSLDPWPATAVWSKQAASGRNDKELAEILKTRTLPMLSVLLKSISEQASPSI